MFYLLTSILPLMVLGALGGASLMFFWMRSRFEDVTESHDQLLRLQQTRGEGGVSADDLDTMRQELTDQIRRVGLRVEAIEVPVPPDLGPIHTRLDEVAEALRDEVRQVEPTTLDLGPVTAHLSRIEERVGQVASHSREGRKADLETVTSGVAALSSTLTALRMPDLDPVHERLEALERQLTALAQREPPPMQSAPVDLEPLHVHLRHIEDRIAEVPPPDLESVKAQVAALDLGSVQQQLSRIQASIEALPAAEVDLAPVEERLTQIEEGLTAAEPVGLGSISEHVARIEEHLGVLSAPTVDLAPLYERLSEIEALLATLREPRIDFEPVTQRFERLGSDFDGLHARLVGLEGAIQASRAPRVDLDPLRERLEMLDTRLGGLAASVAAIELPETDLTAVIEQFDTIESRLDLVSIENRLTAIEYGLAAVHHQLRSRRTATPAPPRPRFDPIDPMRRTPSTNRLTEAAFGVPDDLTQLDGVGDPLRDLLHDLGVFYFWQVAEWTEDDVAAIDGELLDFRGHIVEHGLVAQARELRLRPGVAARPSLRGAV
ncbi:MAG: hypothetical protein AAF602_22955 [Myxococcota bacterium]